MAGTDEQSPQRRRAARRPTELLIALAAVVVSLIPPLERMRVPGFNSDDVAWVVGLHTWRPGNGTLVLVENTYVLHLPVVIALDLLMPVSGWSLLVAAAALHTVGLWLIISFARRAIAEAQATTIGRLRWQANVTAVAACATYQVLSPITRYANAGVTTRSLEAGVYLLVLRWGYEVVTGRRDADGGAARAIVVGLVAALALNDPLIVVTMLLPFAVVVGIGSAIRRVRGFGADGSGWRRAQRLAVEVGVGLVVWQGMRAGLHLLGIRLAESPESIADPRDWAAHARPVAGGVARIVGRGLLRDESTWVQVVGAVAALLAVVAVGTLLWRAVRDVKVVRGGAGRASPTPGLALVALGWLAIVVVTYWLSTAGATQDSFRYVVVAAPAISVAVAVVFSTWPTRAQAVLWVVAPVAVFGAGTLGLTRDHDDREQRAIDAAMAVERVAADGYVRGYSGYWSGPIVTYHSDFAAPVLAVECRDGRNVPFELLQDLGRFDRAIDEPVARTFILVDRGDRALACPAERLVAQHGEPTAVVAAGPAMEIWLYDRDVVAEVAAD